MRALTLRVLAVSEVDKSNERDNILQNSDLLNHRTYFSGNITISQLIRRNFPK